MSYKLKKSQIFYLFWKRLFDIILSIIGIIMCSGLLWWWVILINLFVTKGHPFFVHQRYGKNKKVFGCLKFRSMRLDVNPNLAPSDMHEDTQKSMETGFGRFMRVTSIDETLQLFNILVGQMSFIGPRPGAAKNEEELVRLRELYTPSAFDVRPGLTGFAQTRLGREHDPANKAYYDNFYVVNLSFWLDTKIFIVTILKMFGVLKGR